MSWWRDAVVYQVYPRSFQDADGDGVGDLAGIQRRLDHVAGLGAHALWLSPTYPSPLADFGYDVSDFCAVDPVFGSLGDLDGLIAAAHARGLRLLMDLVPCHTSIEHPWFREHPDWYIWAEGRGDGPPNNWVAAFGGPAWSRDPDGGPHWYLHSFYPEQPDLDWRNADVVSAMQGVIRYWTARGVDGFRVDAIERLLKDPLLRDDPPAAEPFALPLHEELARLSGTHSRNSPDIGGPLGAIREAADGRLLVGEVYLPSTGLGPYLEHLHSVFSFELFHSPWEAGPLSAAIAACAALEGAAGEGGTAWVLSNHDFPRLPNRFGRENARAAAVLLLTLPGLAFVYQGEEIGQGDGPGGERIYDRAGRDAHRHPVQWTADPGTAGFTTGTPWLPPVDPLERSVQAQSGDPGSLLELYRSLITLRPSLGAGLRMLDAAPGVVSYERGHHTVVLNTSAQTRPSPAKGSVLIETEPGALRAGEIAAHAAAVTLMGGAPGR